MIDFNIGDIVTPVLNEDVVCNGVLYKALIKGEKYKVLFINSTKEHPIEITPINEDAVYIFAKREELRLVFKGVVA